MKGSKAGLIPLLELSYAFLRKRNSGSTVKDECDIKTCVVGRKNKV
jgi:hypothetical protein